MASPQLENGYTKISNELLEALGRFNATSSQFRVMMILFRNTYGYGEKGRPVATSKIIKDTGMNKSQCIRTINELLVAKMIRRSPSGNLKAYKYWIQKDYDQWNKPIREVARWQTKGRPVANKSHVVPSSIKERKSKRTRTAKTLSQAFLSFWEKYPVKKGKGPAYKSWKKQKPDLDIVLAAIELQTKEKENLKANNQFCPEWPYPATWLNQERWDDEPTETVEDQKNGLARFLQRHGDNKHLVR